MFVTRESVYVALFTLLQNNMSLIKTFERRYKTFDMIPSGAAMPYLILCTPKESYPARAASGLPAKRTALPEIIIYFQAGQNQQSIPDTMVNNILDQLDEALYPPPLTLGGKVDHCYIEGDITRVPGDLDGIGYIHISLKITFP